MSRLSIAFIIFNANYFYLASSKKSYFVKSGDAADAHVNFLAALYNPAMFADAENKFCRVALMAS